MAREAGGYTAMTRDCMSDRVRTILETRIREGVYPAGTRLVEMRLARELGTSQGPVREALRELEAARLVETEPYRGTRVRAVSEQELRDGCQVRAVLEELAARLALRRFRDDLEDLRAAASAVREAAEKGDAVACARLDLGFRRAIVEASGNPVLIRAWTAIAREEQASLSPSFSQGNGGNVGDVSNVRNVRGGGSFGEDHRLVVEAFERGEGRVAGALLRQSLEALLGAPADPTVPMRGALWRPPAGAAGSRKG